VLRGQPTRRRGSDGPRVYGALDRAGFFERSSRCSSSRWRCCSGWTSHPVSPSTP